MPLLETRNMAAVALNPNGIAAGRPSRKAKRPASRRRLLTARAAGSNEDKPTAQSVLSFLCPLLKAFGAGDAAAPRNRTLEVATSGFASIARLPFGSKVDEACIARPASAAPKERIVLYEFEACPFCRRVREALSQLDLTVEVRPCPKDAVKHRAEVEAMGGKLTFPFLVDPNTDAGKGGMYESEDICRYLYDTYGNGAEFPEGDREHHGAHRVDAHAAARGARHDPVRKRHDAPGEGRPDRAADPLQLRGISSPDLRGRRCASWSSRTFSSTAGKGRRGGRR